MMTIFTLKTACLLLLLFLSFLSFLFFLSRSLCLFVCLFECFQTKYIAKAFFPFYVQTLSFFLSAVAPNPKTKMSDVLPSLLWFLQSVKK